MSVHPTDKAATKYWIWVFGKYEALEEVLDLQRMGFPARVSKRVETMAPGDRAIMYLTRGAFGNPNRDRSRVAAVVTVTSAPMKSPVSILQEEYPLSLGLAVDQRIEDDVRSQAPEVQPIAEHLTLVKRPEIWGQYFRNTPLEISSEDFQAMAALLRR